MPNVLPNYLPTGFRCMNIVGIYRFAHAWRPSLPTLRFFTFSRRRLDRSDLDGYGFGRLPWTGSVHCILLKSIPKSRATASRNCSLEIFATI